MMLPPSCQVARINPRTVIVIEQTSSWLKTDLEYTLELYKLSHVIIMYQHTGWSDSQSDYYFVTRIKINSDVQKHTVYHSAPTSYYGNFGLWQGQLYKGPHTILVEYRNNGRATSKYEAHETRALTIVYC